MNHEQAIALLLGVVPDGVYFSVEHTYDRHASGRAEWEWTVYVDGHKSLYGPNLAPLVAMMIVKLREAA